MPGLIAEKMETKAAADPLGASKPSEAPAGANPGQAANTSGGLLQSAQEVSRSAPAASSGPATSTMQTLGTSQEAASTPQPNVREYEADQVELDEQNDTVAGRISQVIAQNSPLMQSARTKAAQEANRRGLLNSAMAVSAGEQAVIETALPIAQQDAQQSYDARVRNADANNAASQFNAGAYNTQSGQVLAGDIQGNLQAQAGDIESRLQEQRGQIDLMLQNADEATRSRLLEQQALIDERLARVGGEIQSQLALEQYGYEADLLNERGQIDLMLQSADAEDRERLLARQGEIDSELAVLQGEIQTRLQQEAADQESQLLAQRGQIDAALLTAEGDQRAELLNQQASIDERLARVSAEIEGGLMDQRAMIDQALLAAEGDQRQALQQQAMELDMQLADQRGEIDSRLQAERGLIELQLAEADGQIRDQLLVRQGEIDAQLTDLRNQGAMELADLEGQWRNVLQNSASATTFYSEIATQIGSILANNKIKASDKTGLVNQLKGTLNDGLQLIGDIGNVDFSGLLDDLGGDRATDDDEETGGTGGTDDVRVGRRDGGGVDHGNTQ